MTRNTRLLGAVERRPLASRISTGAIGAPLLFLVVWLGSPWLSVLVAAVAAVAALEVCNLARGWGDRATAPAAMLLSAGLVVAAHVFASESWWRELVSPVVGGLAGVALVWLVFQPQRGTALSRWIVTAGAALYTGGLLAHAPLLRGLEEGHEWLFLLLLVTFAADISAYVVGKTVGRSPLAPSVSPSKTWEGAAGGLAGAMGTSIAAVHVLGLDSGALEALALGALIGALGQLGDLAESRLKRSSGVKDSGSLLPGHGGVLDRIDSIVFNLVVVYYLVS